MFIVLSLFTVYLCMAGYAVISFSTARGRLFEGAGLAIAAGILVNYSLMLTGLPIRSVFIAGAVVAVGGLLKLGADLQRRTTFRVRQDRAIPFSLGCVGYLLAVYYLQILSEPLLRWDARSIWFFHAKMIWAAGGLGDGGDWSHPAIGFSHPHYPKLIPAMAAQLAYLMGYWNEFVPKGSLVILLIPLLFWVFSFRRATLSFALLLVTGFLSLDAWFSNGYMDKYLALYCGVSLLLLGRCLIARRDADLYSTICALGIAASLKNEGLLFAASLAAALLIASVRRPETLVAFWTRLRTDGRLVRMVILSIAPTVMWTIWQRIWGLQNDLTADLGSDGLARLSERLRDGSSLYILNYLVTQATAIWVVIALLAFMVVFSLRQQLRLHPGTMVAAATAALYFCGLFGTYLTTVYDLTFHVTTSAGRTMATTTMALVAALFFLLSGLETQDGDVDPSAGQFNANTNR